MIQQKFSCRLTGALLAGLMLSSAGVSNVTVPDGRAHRLHQFLAERNSPMAQHAHEFVRVADEHGLDWRLLPSIAIIESSGGKYCRNQNAFGWANGDAKFRSMREGIQVVGERLARAPVYKSKSTTQKLKTYNPAPHYARAVIQVMRVIDDRS